MGALSFVVEVVIDAIGLGLWIWLCARIWKSSAVGAVLTFILVIPAFYFLWKTWGEEVRDIRAPFFINLVVTVALIAFFIAMPGYQFLNYSPSKVRKALDIEFVKSNPEMERWCREKNDAVYSPALQTCVEADPNQKPIAEVASGDVMAQLETYFSQNGLRVDVSEVDETSPGGKRMKNLPNVKRGMQFIFEGNAVMPTMAIISECVSVEACSAMTKNGMPADSPILMVSNGALLFMGFPFMGDEAKILQARNLFSKFQAR